MTADLAEEARAFGRLSRELVPPHPADTAPPAPVTSLRPAYRTAWTAADLLAADFPEPRWAVPGVVAEGLTLLAGAPKLGKSWLAMNLAAAVGAGGKALGKVDVDQGDSLYLALEDPPRRLQQRLRIVLEGDTAPAGLHFDTSWPLLHDGGLDQLDKWLDNHDGRLVVVDVLTKIRGTVSEKEDRYTADYRAMTGLKVLADNHGVAIVVVHHTRKATAEDFLDMVSGTHGLAGAADTVAVLARSRGSADATLNITGRDVGEAKLALSLKAGRWTLLDGPAEDYELGDTRRRILSLIRGIGPRTPKQIASTLGFDHELTKKTCKRMADDGQLVVDRGTYSVPDPMSVRVPPVPLSLMEQDEGHGDGRDTHRHTDEHDLLDLDDRGDAA